MDGGREATSDISMEVEKKTYYMAKIQWVTGGPPLFHPCV